MPINRHKGLNVDAFVALMAEMGVEAIPLPESKPADREDEVPPAGDSATE